MTIKVKFWTYTESGGDGSAYPRFFVTEAAAEEYRVQCEEAMEEGWGESCVASQELEFDDQGVLQNPDVWEPWD